MALGIHYPYTIHTSSIHCPSYFSGLNDKKVKCNSLILFRRFQPPGPCHPVGALVIVRNLNGLGGGFLLCSVNKILVDK
jgi:hypothetical protein